MANPALVVRVAASLEELKRNLREGRDQIETTTASMQKLATSFQGDRLIQQAHNVVAAVNQIGGAAKLSEREQARVNATLEKAIEKYRLLGQEAPSAMRQLHAQTTANVGPMSTLSGLVGQFRSLLPIASVAGFATALLGMARAAFESADQIVTLSNKTGLSTDAIQRMQFVAGQTSTSVDALAQATFKLGVNVASGSGQAKDALFALGVSFDAIRSAKPEQQFDLVVKALEGVEDVTERNRLGVALFGRQFAEIAPAIAEGYSRIKDEATIAGEAQVRAAEAAGDAWEGLKSKIATVSVEVLGGFSRLLMGDLDDLSKLTSEQIDQYRQLQKVGGDATGFLQRIAHQRVEDEKKAADAVKQSTNAQEDYNGRVLEAIGQLGALSTTTRQQIESARRLGASAEDLQAQFGLSEDAIRLYDTVLKDATKTTREAGNAAKDAGIVFGQLSFPVRVAIDYNVALNDFVTNTVRAAGETDEFTALILAQAQAWEENTDAIHFGNIAITRTLDLWEPYKATIEQTLPKVEAHAAKTRTWQENLSSLAQAFAQMAQVSDGAFSTVTAGIGRALTALDSIVKSVTSFKDGLAQIRNGDWFSGLLGAATGIVGIVGAVANLFQGWFGVSREVQQARSELERFQQTLRGSLTDTQRLEAGTDGWRQDVVRVRDAFLAVGRTEAEALAIVRQLWDTDHPERMQAAIEEINRVLDEQKRLQGEAADAARDAAQAQEDAAREAQRQLDTQNRSLSDLIRRADELGIRLPKSIQAGIDQLRAMGRLTQENIDALGRLTSAPVSVDKMREIAEQLGITNFDVLGRGFNQGRIGADAGTLVNQLDTLRRGGGDIGGILSQSGVQDIFRDLVQEALRHGTPLAGNLRPYIEELNRVGAFNREEGGALGIGKLEFGPEIKTEFENNIDAMRDLIEQMKSGELTAALTDGPLVDALINTPLIDALNRFPTEFTFRIDLPPGNRGGGGETNVGFDAGGIAGKDWARPTSRDVIPALLRPGEMVVTPEERLRDPRGPQLVDTLPIIVPIFIKDPSESDRATDDLFRQLPQGIALNRHGVRVALRNLVKDAVRG